MKKSFVVTLVVAVIIILAGFASAAFAAEDLLGPSTDPKVVQLQNDIITTDKVMAETRTFRYAFGGVGAAYGAVASGMVAASAGLSVPLVAVTSVAGGIIYGTSFYGATTLGTELVYQDAAKKIQAGRAAAEQKASELKKELKDELREKKAAASYYAARVKEFF
jgi:hypothetical protein